MSDQTFTHPETDRLYREGDPSHTFARLCAALARQAEEYADHHRRRMAPRDYLEQHLVWDSDPSRIAHAMAHTIEAIEKAYRHVITDRDLHTYGIGQRDAEWERKYGVPGKVPE